jgi:hypothetical protein
MDTGGLDGKRNEDMSENQSKVTAGWGWASRKVCYGKDNKTGHRREGVEGMAS